MYESNTFLGLTEAQSAIISHWHGKCQGGRLPMRGDIDPGELRSHLAAISIVEIEPDGGIRFRIAGSEVRSIFGREMRGRRLHECHGPEVDMWALGLTAALDRRAPVGGVIERSVDCHTWLRLPLEVQSGTVLVLCHDMIMPKSRFGGKDKLQSSAQSNRVHVLAA